MERDDLYRTHRLDVAPAPAGFETLGLRPRTGPQDGVFRRDHVSGALLEATFSDDEDVEPHSDDQDDEQAQAQEQGEAYVQPGGGAPEQVQASPLGPGVARLTAAAAAAPDPTPRKKSGHVPHNSRCHTITYDMLAAHFHLSVVEAAVRLGVSRTTLKTVCRQHGIKRWPKRALVKMELRDPDAIMRTALSLQPYPWQQQQDQAVGGEATKPAVKKKKKKVVEQQPGGPGPKDLARPAARETGLQAPRRGGLMDAIHQGSALLVTTRACPWMR